MSKRIMAGRSAALAVLAACACALAAGAGAAGQKSKPAAVNPKTAAVREATAEVLRETSQIRKLPVLRQVRSGAQSRAEIEQMLVRNINESATPEENSAREAMMKKLGLAPADFHPIVTGSTAANDARDDGVLGGNDGRLGGLKNAG